MAKPRKKKPQTKRSTHNIDRLITSSVLKARDDMWMSFSIADTHVHRHGVKFDLRLPQVSNEGGKTFYPRKLAYKILQDDLIEVNRKWQYWIGLFKEVDGGKVEVDYEVGHIDDCTVDDMTVAMPEVLNRFIDEESSEGVEAWAWAITPSQRNDFVAYTDHFIEMFVEDREVFNERKKHEHVERFEAVTKYQVA